MVKEVVTPKQTAGRGFAFEDLAVAYYLVWMLDGTSPLKVPGRIDRIDCQVAADGWEGFDDLLITLIDRETVHRCAFSLKSNLQFTKKSAPFSLVKSAWSLLLHLKSDVMNIENDEFGLICIPHPEPPLCAIQNLLIKARWQSAKQLSTRLGVSGYASVVERDIYNSCSCPIDFIKDLSEEQTLAGNLLRKMSVIELDFESKVSSSEVVILSICKRLVADGTNVTAQNLWNGLCQIAQRVRTAGGGISREELLKEIRSLVELQELPDFTEDWHNLDVWCNIELSAIKEQIAGKISVDRDESTAKIMNYLQTSRFIGVVGASGTGKTVLAKHVAKEFCKFGNVLSLKAERLRPGYVESLGSNLHLRHPLMDVLSHGKYKSGLVILDSGERLIDDVDFSEICLLLHMLEMQRESCIWRLLLICREEAWDRVQFSLTTAFGNVIQWELIRIDYPDFKTLKEVWKEFPTLRKFAIRPHLSQLMRNLKVLDLLAAAISKGRSLDSRLWVGETDLIKCYWQQVVRSGEDGVIRDVLLRKLATENADNGRFETSEVDFLQSELVLIRDSSDMLATDAVRSKVSFTHDLISDWARFQVLVSHEHDFVSYCENRFTNPHWHTAFRLYGMYLLETDVTGQKWQMAISTYPKAQNPFLESLVFSGSSHDLIKSVWLTLITDKGSLLYAFLKQFQHIASIPNPEYMKLVGQFNISAVEAQTLERLPLWMYWLGVLNALVNHIDDVLKLAHIETARLARSWLRYTPLDWPGRKEAATLAINIALQEIRIKPLYLHSDNDAQLPYRALMEAYPDKPDEVREILLKAAARKISVEENKELVHSFIPPMFQDSKENMQEPWPDGPLKRVDEAFRAACLKTDALRVIMINDPDLAMEIILALLIKPPLLKAEMDSFYDPMFPERAVCLENDHSFYPPFYTRGPFLSFLKVNPEAALKTIIRLIDFATERWMECHFCDEERKKGIDLLIDSSVKRFIGDYEVYQWYHGFSKSHIVSSALKAIEKWLYDCLDKKETIDKWLGLILKTGQSIAFLGVLSEIGKYSPELFVGALRPLILVLDIYLFETKSVSFLGTPASLNEGEWFFNLARQWNMMNHRKRRIIDIAAYFFQSQQETREALLSARVQWIELTNGDDENLKRSKQIIIATFDPANWQIETQPDGAESITFKEPDHLKVPSSQINQIEKQILLLTLPGRCRSILSEGKKLESEQVHSFFEKSKELLGFSPNDKELAQNSPAENAILGVIAVLFVLHRDWLRANPDEERWCITMLDKILVNPPPWPRFDMPDSFEDCEWEHFACDITPVIWAEDLSNKVHRARIAHLVFAKHYNATGILLFRTFERRARLGEEFWRLTNLVLDWAAFRYKINDSHYNIKSIDVQKWIKKSSSRFIAGKYSSDLSRWGRLSLKKDKRNSFFSFLRLINKNKERPKYQMPVLDLEQIHYSFNTIFLPAQAISESERKRFLIFWEEALFVCLVGTRLFDENSNRISSERGKTEVPDDYEQWVLKQIVAVISQLQSDEEPDRYWKPILSLGASAENWVEHFLDYWFLDAKKVMDRETFINEWKKMIEYCLNSEAWGTENSSLLMCLMGLPRFIHSLWQDLDAPIIAKMETYFTQIAPYILKSTDSAARFLSWLSEIPATGIRYGMLKHVADVGLAANKYWWQQRNIAEKIAMFLSQIWKEHRQTLEHEQSQKKIFLELLHKASETQDPIALALQLGIARNE